MQRTWWPEAGTIIVTGPYWTCVPWTGLSRYEPAVHFTGPDLFSGNWPIISVWLMASFIKLFSYRFYRTLKQLYGEAKHSLDTFKASRQCRIYASVNWVNISSCNGLAPVRRQAITWTNTGLLLIGLLGTNFCGIRIGILSFSFKKMHLRLSSAKMTAILSGGRWVQ